MSAVLTLARSAASRTDELASADDARPVIDGQPGSACFGALLGAYRSSGGTARGDDLARLLADHQRGDYVSLARLVVAADVFGFEWRHTLWIPMFQFESRDLAVKPAVQKILAELPADCDGWAQAAWFANGNTRLGGRRPVDLLGGDLPAVLAAARAEQLSVAGRALPAASRSTTKT